MMFVAINTKRAFISTSDKICLPVMEVLLYTATGDLAHENNLHNWVILSAVLLPPLLTNAVILYNQDTAT